MSASNIFSLTNTFFSGSNGSLSAVGGVPTVLVTGISSNISFASGVTLNRTQVSTTPYTGKSTDYLIGCLFSSGTSGVIVLPSNLTNTLIIKDESGTAHISNIIISGLPNIERASSYLLGGSGAAITVYPTPNGWRIY
jgi:hypothetical protein